MKALSPRSVKNIVEVFPPLANNVNTVKSHSQIRKLNAWKNFNFGEKQTALINWARIRELICLPNLEMEGFN